MGNYFTVQELVEVLSKLDRRRLVKTPYVSGIEYFFDGRCQLVLTSGPKGGSVKKIEIGGKDE